MDHQSEPISRGAFLRRSGGLLAAAAFGGRVPSPLAAEPNPLEHPEPRPGVTAERVLSVEALGSSAKDKVRAAYDAARAYPSIFDGLACGCGCTGVGPMHRSLLVCYETTQPTGCMSCQLEATFVAGLTKQDASLSDIRAAVDKKFG